jgi:hypothetical protein
MVNLDHPDEKDRIKKVMVKHYESVTRSLEHDHLPEFLHMKSEKSGLFVRLLSGKNLLAADMNGKSDPYCIVQLHGDFLTEGETPVTRRTKVIRETLNPIWNNLLEFPMPRIPVGKQGISYKLEIVCKDRDLIGSDDPLGKVVLDLTQLVTNHATYPDKWHPLELADGMTEVSGSLRVGAFVVVGEEDIRKTKETRQIINGIGKEVIADGDLSDDSSDDSGDQSESPVIPINGVRKQTEHLIQGEKEREKEDKGMPPAKMIEYKHSPTLQCHSSLERTTDQMEDFYKGLNQTFNKVVEHENGAAGATDTVSSNVTLYPEPYDTPMNGFLSNKDLMQKLDEVYAQVERLKERVEIQDRLLYLNERLSSMPSADTNNTEDTNIPSKVLY